MGCFNHQLEKSYTWNAKCPIFWCNFTPKTSNYCLKNRALGFPGMLKIKEQMASLPCAYKVFKKKKLCIQHLPTQIGDEGKMLGSLPRFREMAGAI